MKIKSITLLIVSFLALQAYSQTSWNYSIWFNLLDETGDTFTKEAYLNKKIQLITFPSGAHKSNTLEYDTQVNAFKFSQSTLVTESVFMFIHNKDTTTITIGTENMYIKDIALTGDTYKIYHWKNENNFLCNQKFSGIEKGTICVPKSPFKYYKTQKKSKYLKKVLLRSKKPFEKVNFDENKDEQFEYDIELLEKKIELTKSLKALYKSPIKAIYPIETNKYLVFQEYSSGNGNHYYDNISITLVAIGEHKITYLPFNKLQEENAVHTIDDHGNLVFSQHQRLSDFTSMDVYFDQKTKTIFYQYQYFKSIGDSEKTILVKGAYQLKNKKLVKVKK